MDVDRNSGLDSVRIWQCTRQAPRSAGIELQKADIRKKLAEISKQRDKNARSNGWTNQATWIHIPSNDVNLCREVLRAICHKKHAESLLQSEYWLDQMHEPAIDTDEEPQEDGSDSPTASPAPSQRQVFDNTQDFDDYDWTQELVKAPFMDARTWNPSFRINDHGKWQHLAGHKHDHDDDTSNHVVENTIIYMPYLHWAKLDDQNRATKERHNRWVKSRTQPGVHPRRSLDEAALRHLSYESLLERNCDQVVLRHWERAQEERQKQQQLKGKRIWRDGGPKYNEEPTIMVVDQLWMWMLDKDTLVTSFPDSPGSRPSNECKRPNWCEDLHLECLARAAFNAPGHEHHARRLAYCVINRSYSIFHHPHIQNLDLRYWEMFSMSIEHERVRSSDLFIALQGKKKRGFAIEKYMKNGNGKAEKEHRAKREAMQKQHSKYDIREDIASVARIRDIEEELRIILYIVELQKAVLARCSHPRKSVFERDLKNLVDELNALCAQSEKIHEKLFQTLELKQTLLSVRQNNIVLVFTVATVVFLPLGFISSIFGMNAAELNDGSPVKLKRIFTYMFPISFAISIIAFSLTYVDIDHMWRRNVSGLVPSKGWAERHSTKRNVASNRSHNDSHLSESSLAPDV